MDKERKIESLKENKNYKRDCLKWMEHIEELVFETLIVIWFLLTNAEKFFR